ncbi:hypothetical protein [Tepidibacter hydrothermalis]|uniref:Uncharacterized protein n=1 Tax=Tepidibacter hydrothermalis TaxID=3036126 RepID=A0ABY8EA97_9FIRM|nr:hypothetical protein [Tepidibacter hydrothermalis]WFD09861.1 hypothetical protein P4S50_15905 [Tepidibacter hydrothermalis]
MKNKIITLMMVLLLILSMTMTSMAQEGIKKDGLTASEMIQKGIYNQSQTVKVTSELNSHKKFTGYSIEKIPDPNNEGKFIEEEQKIDESMDDKSYVVGIIEESEKSRKEYYKSISLIDPLSTSEQFWDQNVFYGRMGENKWIKKVMDPVFIEILRETDKEVINRFATYDKDTLIDGKEYYVINLNAKNDVRKEIALKVMDKICDKSLLETNPEINKEEIKKQLLKKFAYSNINTSSKYYINKDTKILEFIDKTEIGTITIDKMNIEMSNTIKYKYYDFNQPVNFPEILPEDVQE